MREETIQWLKEKNYPIAVLPSKWKMPMESIAAAAEIAYDRIQAGQKIKDIQIGWLIRSIAQSINNLDKLDEIRNMTTIYDEVDRLWAKAREEISEQTKSISALTANTDQEIKGVIKLVSKIKQHVASSSSDCNKKIDDLAKSVRKIAEYFTQVNKKAEDENNENIKLIKQRLEFLEKPLLVRSWINTKKKYKG